MQTENLQTPVPAKSAALDLRRKLFDLGKIASTPAAMDEVERSDISIISLIQRHVTGDWREMPAEDAALNLIAATKNDGRILSAYTLNTGVKVWLITEADRSVTTLLLPSEY